MRIRYPTLDDRGHLVLFTPLSPFIRIQPATLDDRGVLFPSLLTPNTDPARHTGRPSGSSPALRTPNTDPARHTGRPWGLLPPSLPRIRIQPDILDDRGVSLPTCSTLIRIQPGTLDDRRVHIPPFLSLIRIQSGILDDRGVALSLRLPQYGSGNPSQTTVRVSSPLLSTNIDKGRPSHVGTYGVKATK